MPGPCVNNPTQYDDLRSTDYYHKDQKIHKYKQPGQPSDSAHTLSWIALSPHLGTCGPVTVWPRGSQRLLHIAENVGWWWTETGVPQGPPPSTVQDCLYHPETNNKLSDSEIKNKRACR